MSKLVPIPQPAPAVLPPRYVASGFLVRRGQGRAGVRRIPDKIPPYPVASLVPVLPTPKSAPPPVVPPK